MLDSRFKDAPARRSLPTSVLVADDHASLRRAVCRVLMLEGVDARGVSTGEAALDAVRSRDVDVLVTDIIMPGYNGLDLARRACMIQPNLRLLFMSGFTNGCFADGGVLHNVTLPDLHFLGKPFGGEELLARLSLVAEEDPGLYWDGPARITRASSVDEQSA